MVLVVQQDLLHGLPQILIKCIIELLINPDFYKRNCSETSSLFEKYEAKILYLIKSLSECSIMIFILIETKDFGDGVKQRWKNLGVKQIIRLRMNVHADIFDHLADKNVREKILRVLLICCKPRFFHSWCEKEP